ncbi:MAG: hypothetical protein ICV60_18715, partial [Pyrinomonadaceae bacterium]|nr:hypothetical protein [Pyrinomonadaceae bacterium]
FSLERMAGDYLKIYEEALRNRRKSFSAGRSLFGLMPRLGWKGYLEYCWSGGHCQYLASQKLAEEGRWRLAKVAAHSALFTCPTLFTRPQRAFHLFKMELRSTLPSKAVAGTSRNGTREAHVEAERYEP